MVKNNNNKFNFNNITCQNTKFPSNKTIICSITNFNISDFDKIYHNKWIEYRKKTFKRLSGSVYIKIGVWNLQSLNKDINNRYMKIEYLRDILTDNKLDIIYLIDVNNTSSLILNGYKKYDDTRNILFVKDEILDPFTISRNCIFNESMKLAFTYLTPNSTDYILINNLLILINMNYTIVGDVNFKSNKIIHDVIPHFTGEDSLQIGFISDKLINVHSIAAPSDHRFVIGEMKIFANLMRSLKIGEMNDNVSKDIVFDILKGNNPKFIPKITIPQYHIGLNDREKSINNMIDNYLNNNTRRLFEKFNFLWKFDRREPFLGKSVPKTVRTSYAIHLKENVNKIYKTIPNINNIDKEWIDSLVVKPTKSNAINHEFLSLKNISQSINEFLLNPDNKDFDFVNNIINLANKYKNDQNAETFFLQKNRIINDFNDVRVIMIVPTLIKIFESIIFNKVMTYLSEFLNQFKYQYGGIISGSTYKAMAKIKLIQEEKDAEGVILFDMAKGYDTVNLAILRDCFQRINDDMVKNLLITWVLMVYNMDVLVNNIKVKRTRGIPMGLSLSPIVFVYYVHIALEHIDKSFMAMYIDDIALALYKNQAKLNYNLINNIIAALKAFDLIINEKKTMYDTPDDDLDRLLNNRFKKFDTTKYLGRNITINGDGKIIQDDRYFNLKGNRSDAMIYWATFFVKRIIYNAAIDAKLRYKLIMWSTDSIVLRKQLWIKHWSFLRKCMQCYSYLQVAFSIFNIFRYFIDISIINKIKKEITDNTKDFSKFDQILFNRLITNIPQIDVPLKKVKFNYKILLVIEDEIIATKKFLDNAWSTFKSCLSEDYVNRKINNNEKYYKLINEFCNSKLFKGFGSLQLIVFLHFNKKNKKTRIKDAFLLYALDALLAAYDNSINKIFYGQANIEDVEKFDLDFIFKHIKFDKDDEYFTSMDNDTWNNWRDDKCVSLWVLVDKLLNILRDIKVKGFSEENIYKEVNKPMAISFVDGAFNSKENRAGFGWIIFDKDNKEVKRKSGNVNQLDGMVYKNIAGELLGAIDLVENAIKLKIPEICIVYDYYGIEKYFKNEWISQESFIKKYVIKMKELSRLIKLHFKKVYSHTGVLGNEYADILAKIGAGFNTKLEDINEEKLRLNAKKRKPQKKVEYLKKCWKIIFKYLTILEMMYLNSNLNNLNLELLLLNLKIKAVNLDHFCEKNFNLFKTLDHEDPFDDKIF